VEYTEEDPKPKIEEDCKPHCVKEWAAYKACAERIKSDTTGQAHCSGQYFDFWHCVDHCVSGRGASSHHAAPEQLAALTQAAPKIMAALK
ncbi:Cytochrome b-c1 complex subunit 6, partial [Tetrabaena socialis]